MNNEKGAIEIIETLLKAGHEAYLAGGCVRDKLRGVSPKDYDIATSANPETIQKLFQKTIPVGIQFGVILVILDKLSFEVATFRSEGGYTDGRRPTRVSFTTLEEDAKRRDFTVNGLYLDVGKNKVIDFVGGQKDLQKKVLKTIGETESRFLEDHLRMLRAVRFSVQLGFEMDDKIHEVIKKRADLIQKVSQERIREELIKTLTSPNPAQGLRLLDELGLLIHIIPEVETLKGVEQPAQFHPEGDVYVHTLMLLEQLSSPRIELAMGALLHDIAKPATFVRAEDRIRFHGHDKLGAKMARDICKRLTFTNEHTDLICSLVDQHLVFKDVTNMRQSTLRRFIGQDHFDIHMELHRIDCMASHKILDAHQFCLEKKAEFDALPPPPKKLVSGHDLAKMGFAPGPEMGKILRATEDAILEGEVQSKEDALQYVEKNFLKKDLKS